jgi:hypothetical protein
MKSVMKLQTTLGSLKFAEGLQYPAQDIHVHCQDFRLGSLELPQPM